MDLYLSALSWYGKYSILIMTICILLFMFFVSEEEFLKVRNKQSERWEVAMNEFHRVMIIWGVYHIIILLKTISETLKQQQQQQQPHRFMQ
jgi:hypothetical protein